MDQYLRMGIDVGSTTVKIVIVNSQNEVQYTVYRRHNAKQCASVMQLLSELKCSYRGIKFRVAVCGSGGKSVAGAAGVPYIQEVVANAAAICKLYPGTSTAIELGGQDAKVIFFRRDEATGTLQANDMRMNGSCAGGTGAFIDEIAVLLKSDTSDFNTLAEQGSNVYDISGRCGVFAKTDIQPLLNQGAKREDIALSTFHAIAKQTIGGLSQGLRLEAPVIFEGGPLTFNPRLIRVFAERLELSEDDIIIPDHPETLVACGAAMAVDDLFPIKSENDLKTIDELLSALEAAEHVHQKTEFEAPEPPLFTDEAKKEAFILRHRSELKEPVSIPEGIQELEVYIGIDSGSTTSKFVLMNDDEEIVDRFYENNGGTPLDVLKRGLTEMADKYASRGIRLTVKGLGTTGYGENLCAEAFGADCHAVETVAHAVGCCKYVPDASFVLDIGGQDMKAICLNHGVITNIMLNEACSSGCGSFLENFADTLGYRVTEIADIAFSSRHPARLGSRCTVFMNSTIINEQRNGKSPEDIMAGLCRSIIENVFTKVVRIANTSELGDRIVVQGGTFQNFAVLKAIEDYLGKEVILSPYPGEMGAVGAALLAKRTMEESESERQTRFIGFDAIRSFSYSTETGVPCPHCENHCRRNILTFSTGNRWITGNRCERGLEREGTDNRPKPENMYLYRQKMLYGNYPLVPVREKQKEVIGIPMVLEFWDSLPFWRTFFAALGYEVRLSTGSNRHDYEAGLQYVASDTICFPAKVVHGHIRNLAEKRVDRIFFPYIMHMPPEGTDKLSPYVCAVLQGYPMVVRNSQSPERTYHIPMDTPQFHWFSEKNRKEQIVRYAMDSLHADKKQAENAFSQGEKALLQFRESVYTKADEIIADTNSRHEFAVVLAGRPYHNDPFISHDISKMFTDLGIPVLTVDSLRGIREEDLINTRAEITNNFHTRMLSGAIVTAKNPSLEYVQLVSFGCGHDAILSDEIVRILNEVGKKSPLILKVDESDATGSLKIRIQSFVESVQIRHREAVTERAVRELETAFPYKFYKKDKKTRTILVPNISEEVSILLKAIMEKEGFRVKTLPIGGIKQIQTGKRYSHNDICFPAQMVIGELISELQNGNYDQDEVAVGMVKFQCDCRLSHYASLLRRALDNAGFERVPIISTDFNDSKNSQPGVKLLGVSAVVSAVWVFLMMDMLKEIARKIRPYEQNPGETDSVYMACIESIGDGIRVSIGTARKKFAEAIERLQNIPYDRSRRKPRILVTGELLVTYHPGSNFHIEEYLERNGMETILPRVTDQLRKDFLASLYEYKDFKADIFPYPYVVDAFFDHVQKELEKVARRHPLYEKALRPRDIYKEVEHIVPVTLSCGEGWLMAAEIAHYAKEGVTSFIILQPFGCLPNHVCGRGVIKALKDEYPGIQILPLDLDPDTSYANVENRLQMLIMNNRKEDIEADGTANYDRKDAMKAAIEV